MSLAIESGATSSSVIYLPESNNNEEKDLRLKFGSANFQLMSQSKLEDFFAEIQAELKDYPVHQLGIGMAGVLSDSDKLVVEAAVRKTWTSIQTLWIGSDIDTAIASLDSESQVKVIVIAGTGSNCLGTDGIVQSKIGGYGHVLGDRGSSYAIAQKALRLALREYEHNINVCNSKSSADDLSSISPNLLITSIMKTLNIHSISELVGWSTKAHKSEIASLAFSILQSWKSGNALAKAAVEVCIEELAEDCVCLIGKFTNNNRIDKTISDMTVEVGLTGSLFTKNEEFSTAFMNIVRNKITKKEATVKFTLLHETVQGAIKKITPGLTPYLMNSVKEESNTRTKETEEEIAKKILPDYLGLPQTECRNERSMNLDKMSIADAIDLMLSEERGIYDEIIKQKETLEILIQKVSDALKVGGRLFYVGSGTSGRLGILDASECPPTFRSNPEWVQGIIAGGFSSVSKAKEGAEDSIIDGMNAIEERGVNEKDIVVGIAASGRTPFVWGAMYQAKILGALTAFLTFNVKLEMKIKPDLVLAMDVGPEILTGSTRLKCGSATKCILNILSTLAMVKMGKCFENLMVDLNPANQKLRERALRIVLLMTSNLRNVNESMTLSTLQHNNYDIKKTVLDLRKRCA